MLLGFSSIIFWKETADEQKQRPFECGFSPKKNNRVIFSTQFFLVALIFVIFDVELILLFPILLEQFYYSNIQFMFFVITIFILSIGLVWEWNQSMLDWTFLKRSFKSKLLLPVRRFNLS